MWRHVDSPPRARSPKSLDTLPASCPRLHMPAQSSTPSSKLPPSPQATRCSPFARRQRCASVAMPSQLSTLPVSIPSPPCTPVASRAVKSLSGPLAHRQRRSPAAGHAGAALYAGPVHTLPTPCHTFGTPSITVAASTSDAAALRTETRWVRLLRAMP
eukprot:365793-Chlamydomonas_euryale.AAC.3